MNLTDIIAKAMTGIIGALAGAQPMEHLPAAAPVAVPITKAGEWLTTDISSAGAAVAQQQDRFIQTMILESQLLSMVRTQRMLAPEAHIDRLAFTGRVLHAPAGEVTGLADAKKSKPATARVTLTAKEYVGQVDLGYSTLENAIESARIQGATDADVLQGTIRATILSALAKALARDIELFALQGDTTSSDADLAVQDGFLKLASNRYDHSGGAVDASLFEGTLKKHPVRFRQDKSNLGFFGGFGTELAWRTELSDRASGLGDVAISAMRNNDIPGGQGANLTFGALGVPYYSVSQVPETLATAANRGQILLTNRLNMIVGIRREITLDWEKQATKRLLTLVPTVRTAFKFEDPDGATVGEEFVV